METFLFRNFLIVFIYIQQILYFAGISEVIYAVNSGHVSWYPKTLDWMS